MKLIELEAEFLQHQLRQDGRLVLPSVRNIGEAQGVSFLCPHCVKALGGHRGAHTVICWSRSRGVPETATPGPGRWALEGTSLADLSLIAEPSFGARSIDLTTSCGAHFFVTNGEVH